MVSDNAFFGTADLTDFYLGTPVTLPLSQRQFIRIDVNSYSPAVLARLSLLPFIRTARKGKRFVIFRIDQTMYGLKDAGKLSNLRLVSLLLVSASGFLETTTPCLFRHVSRPISFVLVVGDFGIKYRNRDDYEHLISCLSRLYHVKSHPIASKFLGFAISHDRSQRTLSLSYPGYVDALLHRLRPQGVKPAASPAVYHPPVYGSSAPQHATTDSSSPATTAQKKELEIAIGYLSYYGRCVDGRVLTATCALASAQTSATLATMADLDRLLGFVSAHPNGMKIFRPSTMTLDVLTDASYLSRPNAGSVAGSFHHLARCNDSTFFNAPSPFTPRVSPWCALPFRKRSMGARLPLQRSRTSSAKFSRTSATLSLSRRFIAIMKSPCALPAGPSSPRCRSRATCASTGFRTGSSVASSGSSTFLAFGTWLIFSPSRFPWFGTKLWLPSSLWIPPPLIYVRNFPHVSLV